jgi:cysteine-rich repeat protein
VNLVLCVFGATACASGEDPQGTAFTGAPNSSNPMSMPSTMTTPTDGMGSTSAPAPETDGVDVTTGTTSTGTTAGSDTDAPATDTTAVATTEPATSAGTDGCPEGGLFCACYGNQTCNDGLVCENDVCVPESEPVCGDGMLAGMEECDNGAGNADTATCKSDCTLQKCGDGFLGPGEACDDGNAVDNDACSNACIAASCGDLVVQMGEACDDGNAVSTDACINCKAAVCGDTFVYAGIEQCDDGNAAGGDGCSASCQIEAPQCGGNFTTGWCPQNGTNQQFTRCESVSNNNKTCNNPFIKYGSVENGVPAEHGGNDFNAWCTQLGFSGWSGQVGYGSRPCDPPQGRLFGCNGYDEAVWHWCDWQDGNWLNQQLNYWQCNDGAQITSITCQ